MKRPTWDQYFINVAKVVAERATCDRGKSGAIIVKDKRILCTGYVGSPVGLRHCDEAGHILKETVHEDGTKTKHCVRTTHAEQNAICQAARYGVRIDGSTLYCKLEPCIVCAKMIINSGIKRVVCEKRYHGGKETRKMLAAAKVELVALSDEVEEYDHQ